MPTANERRALWFLAIVALSGSVVRMVRARLPRLPAGVDAQLSRQLERVDSAREQRSAAKRPRGRARATVGTAKAPAMAPIVDLDRAAAPEIENLPGIGPALAARIVAFRDSAGRLGSLAVLCEVRGVGPAMAVRLRPLVVFSGVSDPEGDCKVPSGRTSKSHVTNRRQPP